MSFCPILGRGRSAVLRPGPPPRGLCVVGWRALWRPFLLALLCASCARSPCRFNIQFDWTGPLTWVDSSRPPVRRSLTAEETELVTQTATTTLAAAFAEFPRVCVGARGKPTDVLQVRFTDTIVALGAEIRPSDRMFFGKAGPAASGSCPPSQINCDLHPDPAQNLPNACRSPAVTTSSRGRTRHRDHRRARVRTSPQFRRHGPRGRPVVHRRGGSGSTARHSAGRQKRLSICVRLRSCGSRRKLKTKLTTYNFQLLNFN